MILSLLLFKFVCPQSPFVLIVLARTSSIMLKIYVEIRQLWLVPDFSESAMNFSQFILILSIGVV